MTRKEYTDAVLIALRNVTDRERLAIRTELDAHIEDHTAALLELDYPPELAEERALAAMGDPAEVGRELNACYQSWFWVILGRAAAVVTVLLCILALLHVGLLGMVADSISARIYPNESSYFTKPTATERLDIRVPVGNDVLHVYRISVGREDDTLGEQAAEVMFCTYDRIPGGIVSQQLADGVILENPRGEQAVSNSGRGNWRVEYRSIRVPVQEEDPCVTLCYEAFGEQVRLELPLPGRETS